MLEITKTLDGRTFVEGTDTKGNSGSCVLQSDAWDAVLAMRAQHAAMVEFDATVDSFFAPLVEAAEKFDAAVTGSDNTWSEVVLGEDIEGQRAQAIHLDTQGVLLRLLDETDGSMLRWINGGTELIAVV